MFKIIFSKIILDIYLFIGRSEGEKYELYRWITT